LLLRSEWPRFLRYTCTTELSPSLTHINPEGVPPKRRYQAASQSGRTKPRFRDMLVFCGRRRYTRTETSSWRTAPCQQSMMTTYKTHPQLLSMPGGLIHTKPKPFFTYIEQCWHTERLLDIKYLLPLSQYLGRLSIFILVE
jgi:hypothetical protein